MNIQDIFSIKDRRAFNLLALDIFGYQYHNNEVYRGFCDHLKKSPQNVTTVDEIPFLPIEFFKSKRIITGSVNPKLTFNSSGTTGDQLSKHYLVDPNLYEQSFLKSFELFYGPAEEYCILALLPSYLEQGSSSLVYMVKSLIARSKHPQSGFYLNNLNALSEQLVSLDTKLEKVLLIGVSYALLDLISKSSYRLKNTVVMETGGMKGRRREMVKEELHQLLKSGFGLTEIHSEYGMTELLSQGYSKGSGLFKTPPWMKVICRDTEDPFEYQPAGKTGGINVIDLANIHSCSFIATQDLGRTYDDGTFEIIGRFDHADIRGCNLMVL